MPPVITPTVGRVVWYWPNGKTEGAQPEAAHIAYVHSITCVNLFVIGHDARGRPETSVYLRPSDEHAVAGPFAEWMPYQKGQAAKTEALERVRENPIGQSD